MDSLVICELFEVLQVVPPREQEGVGDEAEPRRDLHFTSRRLLQQLLQLHFRNVTVALYLVGVGLQLHVPLKEQDVVYLVLAPHPIRLRLVVDTGQVRQLLQRHLADEKKRTITC